MQWISELEHGWAIELISAFAEPNRPSCALVLISWSLNALAYIIFLLTLPIAYWVCVHRFTIFNNLICCIGFLSNCRHLKLDNCNTKPILQDWMSPTGWLSIGLAKCKGWGVQVFSVYDFLWLQINDLGRASPHLSLAGQIQEGQHTGWFIMTVGFHTNSWCIHIWCLKLGPSPHSPA